MKSICIISDSYYPEKSAAAKLLKDLTEQLLKKKHFVTIVTNGEKNQFIKKKNLRIIKKKIPFIKSKNLYLKFIGEIFMSDILKNIYLKKVQIKQDLVICYSPSIFFTSLIQNIKLNKNGKKLVLIRDIFPDWLTDAGLFKKENVIYKFLKMKQKSFYNSFDVLAVQSDYDKKYIRKIINKNKILITIKNWINLSENRLKIKKKNNKRTKFIFAGNIGLGQDIGFLVKFIEVINMFYSKFHFSIVGDGRGVQDLKKRLKLKNYKNYFFINKIKQNNYENFLSKFDVGIISLNKNIKYNNFPGKLLTYMKCNLPIFAYCSKKIELFNFINKKRIGVAINTYNTFQIRDKIKLIIDGKYQNRKILKEEFSLKKATNKILEYLN